MLPQTSQTNSYVHYIRLFGHLESARPVWLSIAQFSSQHRGRQSKALELYLVQAHRYSHRLYLRMDHLAFGIIRFSYIISIWLFRFSYI